MAADPRLLRAAVTEELERINQIATQLWDGDCDFTAESGHPGWTYGHIATHIARSSDILADSVLSLSNDIGDFREQAHVQAREIDREATRPGAVIITDFEHAARRFAHTVEAVPVENWPTTLVRTDGRSVSVADIVGTWLGEMRLHVPALLLDERNNQPPTNLCLLDNFLPEAALRPT